MKFGLRGRAVEGESAYRLPHSLGKRSISNQFAGHVETLTGTRPFRGSTQQEILLALLRSEYHLPGDSSEMRRIDGIVQRCLAKEPRDRYSMMAELAKDLVPELALCRGFVAHPDVTTSDSPTLIEPHSL